jgi:hypothetical protein
MTSSTTRVDLAPTDDGTPAEIEPDHGRPPLTRLRPPRVVWLATVLFGLTASLWSVAVPQMRAPDEAAHVDLALHLAEGNGYPAYDGRYFGRALELDTTRYLIDSRRPWPRFDADEAPPRSGRPDVDDLGGTAPDPEARPTNAARPDHPYVYNQMPQHPPLYYAAMAGLLRIERALLPGDDRPSLDREVGLLRLANVVLVLPLPLLAWATVVRLGEGIGRSAGGGAALVVSLLPLGVPQLLHITGSVNNDNLLIVLGGVLAVALAGVARGHRGRHTDPVVGVVLGLALLTKAFAVMYLPWVACAYGVYAWTTRRRREAVRGVLVVAAVSAVVGGWWWIANLVRTGQVAPTTETLTRTIDDRPPGFDPEPVSFLWTFAGRLISRTWMWVGYRSPKFELPPMVVAGLTAGVVAAAVIAIWSGARGRDTSRGPRRVDLLLAWLPVALLVVFVVRRAWGLYETTGLLAFIQGRYVFSVLVPPMAVVAIGLSRVLARRAATTVLLVAVVVQAWALREVVGGSWSGPGPWGPVDGLLAWSPWPPIVVVAVAVAAAVTAVAVATAAAPSRALL